MSVLIEKADGTKEPFQAQKLRNSLRRAGANDTEIHDVVSEIESELHEGMTTREIYRHAFAILQKHSDAVSTKYSLRRALFGLGPTGFPFEQFLSRIYETQGYRVDVGATLSGKCGTHEVDLVASHKGDCFLAEAKFHMRPGIKSDMQVALYSYARFMDLKGTQPHKDACPVTHYRIITNTKFTSTAIAYAECAGVELLSWDYPEKNNLQDMIEEAGLYPVSVLQHLNNKEKQLLMDAGVILCRDIVEKHQHLDILGISDKKASQVLEESKKVCSA